MKRFFNLHFPGGSGSEESSCNAGDLSLILALGRFLIEGNGNSFQDSCLENSMDREPDRITRESMESQSVGHDSTTNAFTFYLSPLCNFITVVTVLPGSIQKSFPRCYSYLLKLMCIELIVSSNHLILCYPVLLLPSMSLNNSGNNLHLVTVQNVKEKQQT